MSSWTVTAAGGRDPAIPAHLALEAGPIVPLDPALVDAPPAPASFEALTGAALEPAGALHAAIDTGQQTIVESSDPSPFENAASDALGDADTNAGSESGALDALDPAALVDASASKSTQAGSTVGNYDEPQPPDRPIVEPGRPPEGSEGDPPRI